MVDVFAVDVADAAGELAAGLALRVPLFEAVELEFCLQFVEEAHFRCDLLVRSI